MDTVSGIKHSHTETRTHAHRWSFVGRLSQFPFSERHPGPVVQVAHRSGPQVSNGQIFGDANKHGIISVMRILISLQENKDRLRKNVTSCASWILVFLDILKIIGNSWEGRRVLLKGLYPTQGPTWICHWAPRSLILRSFSQSACAVVLTNDRLPTGFELKSLDYISNTMNFIDSLTLLFLTLSAVKVSCSQKSHAHAHTRARARARTHNNNTRPLLGKCNHRSLMCSSSLPFVLLGHCSCLNKLKYSAEVFKEPLRKTRHHITQTRTRDWC